MRRRLLLSAVGLVGWLVAFDAVAAPPSRLLLTIPRTEVVSPTQPAESARQILIRNAAIPGHVVLETDRSFTVGNAKVYRFKQTHLGIPVYSRGAGLAVDSSGHAILASASLADRLPTSVTPLVSAEEAAAIATKATQSPAAAKDAILLIVPMPRGARLAWLVQGTPSLPDLYLPWVTVDANTGDVIASINATRYTNKAKVFSINPVEDNEVTSTVELPIGSSFSSPDNDSVVSFNCVDQGTVKQIDTGHGLRLYHVCDLLKATPDSTQGDYLQYDRAPDDQPGDYFAQLQIFYHTNKAFDYFRSFEGNSGFKLVKSDTPLYAVANWQTPPKGQKVPDGGLEGGTTDAEAEAGDGGDAGLAALRPYQNAGYMPYTPGAESAQSLTTLYPDQIKGGVMQFGQGVNADYSYDGEVIYHEFTHAVVNATLNLSPYWHLDSLGCTQAPGALNEALADFFSASIANKSKMGTYAVKDMQVVGIPTLTCIRNLDNNHVCPKDLSGEVHTDSEFFAGALWAVRETLASDAEKKKFSEAMFTVMTTLGSGDIGYEDLASAFVVALEANLGQTTSKAMEAEFEKRGVLPQCDRVVEYKGIPLRGTDLLLSYTFVIGGLMEFNASLEYAPSIFQVKVPIHSVTETLEASFRALGSGWGGGSNAFAPSFLINFDAPIAFDPDQGYAANTTTIVKATTPTTSTDGGVEASAEGGGGSSTVKTWSADIPIPSGTKNAYIMLINTGNSGAYYLDLRFDQPEEPPVEAGPEAQPDVSPETGAAGAGGTTGAGGTAGDLDASTPPKDGGGAALPEDNGEIGGGCACQVVSAGPASGVLGLLLAVAAWAARRRRQRV